MLTPAHSPGLRIPSKHVVGVQAVQPGKAAFVQDDPEGSVPVQSPGLSALRSSSEASQLAARSTRVSGVVQRRYDGGDGR